MTCSGNRRDPEQWFQQRLNENTAKYHQRSKNKRKHYQATTLGQWGCCTNPAAVLQRAYTGQKENLGKALGKDQNGIIH